MHDSASILDHGGFAGARTRDEIMQSIDHARIQTLHLHRIEIRTNTGNHSSREIPERLDSPRKALRDMVSSCTADTTTASFTGCWRTNGWVRNQRIEAVDYFGRSPHKVTTRCGIDIAHFTAHNISKSLYNNEEMT